MSYRFLQGRFQVYLAIILTLFSCGKKEEVSFQQDRNFELAVPSSQQVKSLKYPLIFAHGMGASGKLFSFRPVRDDLQQQGYKKLFVTEVSAFNSISHRGRQLAAQIEDILRMTGATKVNLIAHSMGGLDSRFVISKLGFGDRVASLTTIGTPHRGSSYADYSLEELYRHPIKTALIFHVLRTIAPRYNHATNFRTESVRDALENLSPEFVDGVFNRNTPDNERVYYQSWAGISDVQGTSGDRLHKALRDPHGVIFAREGRNDGLVSVSSAKWGTFRGVIAADHFDEIGLGSKLIDGVDYRLFYRKVVADLEKMGF